MNAWSEVTPAATKTWSTTKKRILREYYFGENMKIGILGPGHFGAALAKPLAQ
jgi:hypothetical protein